MKNLLKYSIPVIAAALAVVSCGREFNPVEVKNTPVIDGKTFSPDATAAETAAEVFRNQLVSVGGFNLENVERVEFVTENDAFDAEIVMQELQKMQFRVPAALDLPQDDAPQLTTLNIYSADECIFSHPYYITVPVENATVTGFSPAEGTVGTTITLEGDHLNLVRTVTFGDFVLENSDEAKMYTVSEDGLELVFTVPVPDENAGYEAGDSNISITVAWDISSAGVTSDDAPFIMHTPLVNALDEDVKAKPAAVLTLTGKNLDLLDKITWGGYELTADADASTAESLALTLPADENILEEADENLAVVLPLAAVWSGEGSTAMDLVLDEAFAVDVTPDLDKDTVFDPLEESKIKAGAELALTGKNLRAVAKIMWGDDALEILSQSAGVIVVKFPTREELEGQQTTRTLSAERTDGKNIVIAENFKATVTPEGTPDIEAIDIEDGGDGDYLRLYLNKKVTITGESLNTLDELYIGIYRVEFASQTETEITFTLPEDALTFDMNGGYETATEFELKYTTGAGDEIVWEKKIKAYPFYYYPNITIGAQDASNRSQAFFVPDLGRVLSTDEFADFDGSGTCFDPYIATRTNNTIDVGKDEYYSVLPYIFATHGSNGFALQGAANSGSQIKNLRTSANVQLPSGNGTPIVQYRCISQTSNNNARETAAVEAVRSGNLEWVSDLIPRVGNSGAPVFSMTENAANRFNDTSIVSVNYVAHDGTYNSSKFEDIYSGGLLVIKSVSSPTEVSTATTITFDCYWTKPLRDK